MRRAFVAIPVPDPVAEALEPIQENLTVGRVMEPDGFHITLAFLDAQPDTVLDVVHEALEEIEAEEFEIRLTGLGTFGKASPRILWAGVAPNPALEHLHSKVRNALRIADLELPRSRFRPHVTLARFGDRMSPDDLAKVTKVLTRWERFPSPPFIADRFALFESRRYSDGAVYDVLADYPLKSLDGLARDYEPFSRSTTPAR